MMEQVTTPVIAPGSSRWALAGLALAMLMPSLATSTANVALPALAQAFATSFQAAQWIVLSYLLTVTALIAAVGRLGDIVGRRRLLLAGITIFATASLLCGLAPTLELLVSARIAQGTGAAIMMALTMAFVGDVVPKEKTGSAMGLLGTMSAVGTTLGPVLGGFLIAWAGGRAIFIVNVPLGVLALILAYRTLPADREQAASDRAAFDTLGTALLAFALVAFALTMTAGRGQFGLLNVALLLAALAAGAVFLLVEAKAASPLIRLGLFRDPRLAAGLSTSAIVSTVMVATLVVGPFYLAGTLGLGPAAAGSVLAAGPLVAALVGIPAGRLVDRFGTDRTGVAGLATLLAGACALSLLPRAFGIAGYVVPIIGMTAGYGLFQAANNTAIMTGASMAERGAVSGVLSLSRNLGLVTGASAMGAVFAFGAATANVITAGPEAITAGMYTTFAVAAVLIFVALLIAFRTYIVCQVGMQPRPYMGRH